MLALGSAAPAVMAAVRAVGMGVVMRMLVIMRMRVVVRMLVIVVAVADMTVIEMHKNRAFLFFLYYSAPRPVCQSIYFFENNPREGLRNWFAGSIIMQIYAHRRVISKRKRAFFMTEHTHEHPHAHSHDQCGEQHDHAYMHAHGIAHSHGHVHENQKAVLNRLSRAIGHLEKVKRMVESGEDCSEVLIQLAAVRSALDNTGKVILKDHMRHCMVDAVAAGDQAAITDLCTAIDKFMK